MLHGNQNYGHMLTDMLPILWRRRRVIYLCLILTSAAAFLFHNTVGERYELYTLMRVGQGIKDRSAGGPFGEGPDLSSRIDLLARIATTDQVIRLAASQVGFSRLFTKSESELTSTLRQWAAQFEFLRALPKELDFLGLRPEANESKDTAEKTKNKTKETTDNASETTDSASETKDKAKETEGNADDDKDNHQEVVAALRGLISAKAEGRSDLLRISFRYPDPSIAAEFLNELANALVATQADLVQVPGADVFFEQQTKRLEQETEKAGTALRNFSVSASIYSVADQRTLLLKRADDLGSLIASTRGSIEDRKGQKQAILDQLKVLRPVYQSKTVTGIVNSLRGRDYMDTENTVGAVQNEEAPPLLLVKVYQDAMANLLKVNTDLNGSLRVEKLLVAELDKINAELASLSSKEAEYDRLKRVLTRASAAADHYGSRVIEEQINLDIAKKT